MIEKLLLSAYHSTDDDNSFWKTIILEDEQNL